MSVKTVLAEAGVPTCPAPMRVLLIAYYYPPAPEVGAIRAGRIAASLAAAGHEVQVISVRDGGLPERARDGSIQVRRVGRAFDVRSALVRAKRLVTKRSRNGHGGPTAEGFDRQGWESTWRPPERVPAWRRYLGSLIWLPDDQQGWIPSVVSAGMGAISRGVDVIYTTAPPFSAHIAGLILKTTTRVRWVAELRDPWGGNPWKPWFVRTRFTDAVDARLERLCLERADRVVAVTSSTARDLRERAPDAAPVVMVRNGIPAFAAAPPPARSNAGAERRVVYVGTLYHKRDPRPFLQGLADLRQAGALPPVRVEFIGNCTRYAGEEVAAMCERLGIADLVQFVPPLEHAACMDRIRSADLLLLLAQEQPSQVPQKLYEYLATGRPIIAFADRDGETAEMLRAVGGHYLIADASPANVTDVLGAALLSRAAGGTNAEVLEEWSVETQMRKLVDVIEEIGA